MPQGTQVGKRIDKQINVKEELQKRPMHIWTLIYVKDGTAKEGEKEWSL